METKKSQSPPFKNGGILSTRVAKFTSICRNNNRVHFQGNCVGGNRIMAKETDRIIIEELTNRLLKESEKSKLKKE